MKKFSFSLEKVLEIRKFRQEQAEIEVGRALSAEQVIQHKLDTVASQYAETTQLMRGASDFQLLCDANRFYALLNMQKEQLLEELTQAKLVTEEKRKILQKAMREYEAVAKLREKNYAVYEQELAAEEENLVDDIVTSRYNRGRTGSD